MAFRLKIHHWPSRLAVGAIVLDAGLGKRAADEQAAARLHSFASSAYPLMKRLDARTFTKLVAYGEVTLGAALLLPFVPAGVAGVGLTAFSAGLLGMYLRTPGMRQKGSLRPTEQGLALAQDAWMLGIGLGFIVEELSRTDRLVGKSKPAAGTGVARSPR
ncbi:MAG: hypothetical protein QOK26_2267 [Pseudonocardiales bacterium]|jgi:uncharacterized membrane protein YphA (DoxX/SURF4 family)|uniref:hypothetical protein n=1 Tax=Pseudonocardia sp. Cha107L01 TaxID=3457576 RepID=UPI0028C65C2E|nr:hypothetical protein [Pseudonocardiales bacterium]MDT7655989.1 hypothetical protein [Pseudonocardiales bacterium]MDT7660584.1 hypothetical protein [Pseudonocardiales bacterium]MDT7669555.1 hypothetical protein [Pseudonocardiales bacterium]MDT7682211.1 hypothetical protein [Pseudonocardiales bacterium]